MAKEKGFYKDAGLDVEIREFNNEVNVIDDVVKGKSVFGVGYSSLIYEKANTKEIVLLSAMAQSSPNVLVSLQSSNIKSIKDFKNKKVALSSSSLHNASFISMLQSKNISFKDMKIIEPTFDVAELLSGKVDLAFYYVSNELFYLEKKGVKYTVWNPKDYGFDFYSDILFTSSSELNTNPKVVENFTKASLKGWEYAYSHINETVEIILNQYNSQHKTKEALVYEANVFKKLAYEENKRLGEIDKEKIQRIYDIYNLLGLVKNKIDFDNFIYHLPVKDELTQKEKDYLKSKKSIKMCIDPGWMPYESFDAKGNHIGMSADFFKIFSQQMGIEIVPVKTINWNESLEFAERRKCDIFSLAMETPQRKAYMNFTTPYLSIPLVITTRPNVTYVSDIAQLKNKKVGVIQGYAFNEILRAKHPYLNIVDVQNMDEGLQKVADGELFGFIGTLASVGYKFQTKFTGELKISGKFDTKWELGIGVRNDDETLFEIFQKVVNSLSYDQKQNILNKWLSIKVEEVTNYEHLQQLIILFVVFALVSLYWMRRLAKANRKVKESSDKFEYLFNNTMEGIVLFQNNMLVDVNDSGLRLFRTNDKNNLLSKSVMEFLVPDSIEIVKRNMTLTHTQPYEVNIKRYDGSNFPALVKGTTAIIMGKETRITAIIDLSDLKAKEKALEIAKEKAEESTKLKSEFLANMSHEIRTPMNGIIGMSHLALQTKLEEKQKNYIQKIDESAKSLLGIINDILDFSKIEAGKLQIDKVDFNLSEILNNVSHLVDFKAFEKALNFEIIYDKEMNLNLHGDALRLSQILINLINNAIKFTNEGFVKVEINAVQNNYSFKISDSGIGISPAQQEKLFQSFSQADGSTTRKYGGTGLGLTISKQLIELMGGKIWCQSEENVGSAFIFELSMAEAKNPIKEDNKRISDLKVLAGVNILLTEDNVINQEIILGLLKDSGIIIDIANNGQEAIEMFKENHYELILMDLQMPIMDGYEATKIIRGLNKKIPIIAITANAMKEEVEKTKALGMNEHLNKPLDVEKLYETLLKYVIPRGNKTFKRDDSYYESKAPSGERLEFQSVDAEVGLRHMAGNQKLYLKILREFLNDYKEVKLQNFNDEEFKRVTHTLRGLSANIGATALHERLKELDETQDKSLLESLSEELAKVIDELQKKLKTEKEESLLVKQELTKEKKEELFKKLKEVVNKKRPKECRILIEEIENHQLLKEDARLFTTLKNLLRKYKFKEASEILKGMTW